MNELKSKSSYQEISKDINDFVKSKLENYCTNGIESKTIHDPIWGSTDLMHDVGHCFYSHLSETIYGNLKDFSDLRKDIQRIYDIKPKPHEILSLLIVNSDAFKDFFSKSVNYPNKANLDRLLEDIGKIIVGIDIIENGVIESYQTSIINGSFDVDKLDYIKRDSYTAGLALDYDIERLFTKIKVHTLSVDGQIEHRLVIQANGVTAIEELTFCKIMLFSYIYYHQKVLITEDIIKDYVQALLKLNLINTYSDFLNLDEASLLELAKEQGDEKPFPLYGDIRLTQLAANIKNRTLPKRCLEISQSIVQNIVAQEPGKKDELTKMLDDIRSNPNYDIKMLDADINNMISYYTRSEERYIAGFMTRFEGGTFNKILEIRKNIYDVLVKVYEKHKKKVNFDVFDIYFVFPSVVSYGTPGEKNVLGRDGKLMSINDFVKLEQWASSFNAYKWRGYVYVTPKINKKYALEACRTVIFEDKIELKELKSFLKF